MKTIIKKLVSLVVLICILQVNTNCSSDNPDVTFIPLIGASPWLNVADATKVNTFFFFDIKANSNTSTFTGNENLIGGGQAGFTGSFTNHNISFVYNSTSTKKGSYKGTINDASTEITLTSSDGLPALTLRKQ